MRAIAEPITARSTRCAASAPIEAPRSSTIDAPRTRRPARRDRRPVDAGHGLELEFRDRHQRAGIAGGDRDVGLATLHGVDRHPHRGLPAALAQRLARLGVHRDRDVGMDDARRRLELRTRFDQRLDQGAVAEQQEFDAGMAVERDLRPRERRPTDQSRPPWRRARYEPYPAWTTLKARRPPPDR